MSVMVRVPAPLRRLTNGQDKVSADGDSVNEVVSHLEDQYPGIKARICDEQGELRNFVNLYVNGEDVRFLDSLDTPLKDGSEIDILLAIAGG